MNIHPATDFIFRVRPLSLSVLFCNFHCALLSTAYCTLHMCHRARPRPSPALPPSRRRITFLNNNNSNNNRQHREFACIHPIHTSEIPIELWQVSSHIPPHHTHPLWAGENCSLRYANFRGTVVVGFPEGAEVKRWLLEFALNIICIHDGEIDQK